MVNLLAFFSSPGKEKIGGRWDEGNFLVEKKAFRYKDRQLRLGSNIYKKNAYKIRKQLSSYAEVSCSRWYALPQELNFYVGDQI